MADIERVISLAGEMYKAFESRTRDQVREGEHGRTYYALAEGSPEWMRDAIRAAHDHGEMLPDDQRYEMIRDALAVISDAGSDDDLDDLRDGIEAPAYTSDLVAWLSTYAGRRLAYCDDAISDGGIEIIAHDRTANFTFTLLQLGYLVEQREVFDAIVAALAARAEDEGA